MLRSLSKNEKPAKDHTLGSVASAPAVNRSQYLKRCLTFLLFFICLFFAQWTQSQTVSAPRIRVLNSYHKGLPWIDTIVSRIESVFDREKIFDCEKFGALISSDDNAFEFFREYYRKIFCDTAIIFCGVNNVKAPSLIHRDHFTGILEIIGEKETLDFALNLPQESIIVNKPFSFYEEYKPTVWAVSLLILILSVTIFILNLNITRRKRLEETLLESEARLRSVLETSPVGISIYDETGQCVAANDAIAEMIGATKEQVLQQNYNELESWKKTGTLDKAKSALQENRTKRHELLGKSTFGQTLHLDCYLVPFSPGRLLVMAHDITDRMLAEELLRSESANLKNIFEAMVDGVYIVNSQFEIQYVNQVLINAFGKYEGKKCYEYFHDRTESCPWCKSPDVFIDGKTVHWEWHSSRNDKTYDLIDTPLRNPDGSISKLEIFRDITERKETELELEKHRKHLEALVKEQTSELQEKVTELERMNDLFVDREFRIKQLRDRVKELKKELKSYSL